MPILDQGLPKKKPKWTLAKIINASQISLSIVTPALIMYIYYRIVIGNPIGTLRGSEIAIAVLMQLVYAINLVTLFFVVEALTNIYYGIQNKA